MEKVKTKAPTWFMVVAIIFLIWNAMGVMSFFQHILITDEALQALPEAERNLYNSYPLWTTIAFAAAVFGGAFGCLGLVMRKNWAKMVLLLSFIGVLIQMFHSFFIAKAMDVYGPGAAIMPIMVIVISGFLVWLANYASQKNWLQ
jgi:hypothetical protein